MSGAAILLPYQRAWREDKAQVSVWEKSRRIGASWADAADSVLEAGQTDGSDCFYVGYNREMAQEYIGDVAFWAGIFEQAAEGVEEFVFVDADKDILAYRVRFASGHQVVALSSRPNNLRGRQGKVTIDEAAFHEKLGELLKAALALLMWGGRVRVISTHNGVDNEFNDLVEDIRAGKLPYSLHRTTLDDALEQGLYRQICRKLGRDWSAEAEAGWKQELIEIYGEGAQEELFCIPRNSGSAYFSRALVERCMEPGIPVLRLQLLEEFQLRSEAERRGAVQSCIHGDAEPCGRHVPQPFPYLEQIVAGCDKALWHCLGMDFGRSGDLSYVLVLAIGKDLKRRAVCALELRNVPFTSQEQIVFYLIDHLPRFAFGAFDARGNGQYLAEVALQRYGSARIEGVMATPKFYGEAWPRYRAGMQDGELVLPKDSDLLDDHRLVVLDKKGNPTIPEFRTKGRDGLERHGDGAVAGMLAWYASTQEFGAIEFQSAGVSRVSAGAWEEIPPTPLGKGGSGVLAGAGRYREWDV